MGLKRQASEDSIDGTNSHRYPKRSKGTKKAWRFFVEAVLDKRTNANGEIEYLAKWADGSKQGKNWLPADDIDPLDITEWEDENAGKETTEGTTEEPTESTNAGPEGDLSGIVGLTRRGGTTATDNVIGAAMGGSSVSNSRITSGTRDALNRGTNEYSDEEEAAFQRNIQEAIDEFEEMERREAIAVADSAEPVETIRWDRVDDNSEAVEAEAARSAAAWPMISGRADPMISGLEDPIDVGIEPEWDLRNSHSGELVDLTGDDTTSEVASEHDLTVNDLTGEDLSERSVFWTDEEISGDLDFYLGLK